jgi:hypothetical protein
VSGIGQFFVVVLVGFGTGVLAGMFGIGGGVVSKPAIRALGATPLDAVGSTLPAVIPGAISGTLRYSREGLIRWQVFAWTALVGSVGAVAGALLTTTVPGDGHPLMLAVAGLLAFTSIRLALPQRAPAIVADPHRHANPAPHGERVEWWRCATVGAAAGLLSGLLGIGGGVVLVPSFTNWLRLPLKSALGTSLACVGVLAVPGMITHAILGHVNWAYAIPLCIGVVPGARIGAHLAIRANERTLRLSVAVVLGLIAVVYFAGELASLAG